MKKPEKPTFSPVEAIGYSIIGLALLGIAWWGVAYLPQFLNLKGY